MVLVCNGKHPSASDYFPGRERFFHGPEAAGWMEAGYGGISAQGFSVTALKAWRFWPADRIEARSALES